MFVPVVTLSAENDNKLLEQFKTGFKRTITWNKYRSEISNQTKTSKLNYLIDPTFTNVNRLFAGNMLVDGKRFFEIPVKNKEEAYEANIEKSNDYTTGNLLDY